MLSAGLYKDIIETVFVAGRITTENAPSVIVDVLILMDKNMLMLILIFPTRLKFSLLSTSVFRNLTTF